MISAPENGRSRCQVRRANSCRVKTRYRQPARHGKHHRDQALQQQAGADRGGHQRGPQARVRFVFVERAQQRPQRQR